MTGVPAGERRIVSVLVADVAGSTAIAEQLGPERSKFLFDEVVRLMREEVQRLGGTVAQLTGDGVLALFGAPVAHGDDSERAVRAGLAVHEVLARYAAEVGPAYGIELAARVAVNTGPVVVPAAETPPDVLYNALGDTVNVAARLQTLAGEAGIAIGYETARQLEASFELEPLGDVQLKGKAAAVSAFRVVSERAEPAETAVTPLVGREAELALLERVFEELVEGRGAIVAVTGEPGIGKSRLKTEARERFRDRVRYLEGHAVSYAEEIPYWPFRELLRDWLGLGVSDPEARVRLELRAGLAATLPDDAGEVYPFVATVLGLPLEREVAQRIGEISRDSVQQQTFDAFHRLVCALARERPLCLVLEDFQWADEATLALLEELLSATEEEAVAFVLPYRTEHEHGAWDLAERARRRYRHRFLELELTGLERDAALDLASGAAGAELPGTVAELLAERSGGNPFFLEEALRDLLERGVLRRRNGRLELANGAEDVAVPTLVQEALQARLDRIEPSAREVISVASVVGRSFGLPLLEQLLPREELRPALSELQRLDLVVEERRRPAPEYRFRHGLVQEVAYGGLVEARRRDLHRVVGEALESLHADSPDEVYGLLARHFSKGNDPERAVDYLLRAGDAARALYANTEALEHYREALRFLRELGDEPRARETLLKVALTHHLAFDFERAGAACEEAFALAAAPQLRLEPRARVSSASLAGDVPIPGHTYSDVGWAFARHLYRGLVRVGRDFEVLPDVAEAFSVGRDGRSYRFRLRADAKWTDGRPVTADDFAFTWSRMRQENVATAALLAVLEDANAVNERTLEVRLREAQSYFLYLVAQPPYFAWPRHVCERLGPEWHRSGALVGNGPFTLTEWSDRETAMVSSATWHGPRGNVREVRFERVATGRDSLAGWLEGWFDALWLGGLRRPVENGGWIAESTPDLATAYLGFRADRPPFDSPLVRKAFAHAIDRERVSAESESEGEPALRGGFIPPAMPGHSHRVAAPYDPEAARVLLEQAGFPGGRGLDEIELVGNAGFSARNRVVADQLAELGVAVNLASLPFDSMREAVRSRADAWVWGWVADYPDPGGMLSMRAGYPSLFWDGEIEALLERARSLRDQDQRLETYREIERLWIGEHAAVVPLAYGRSVLLRRPWIEGVWSNALTTSTFAEAVVTR